MKKLSILVALFVLAQGLWSQDMSSSTKLSQRASITQRIGTTDVTIIYHSPSVNGRKIFGEVVPYDFVVDGTEYPWRAGSNQNTTIAFAHDVTIEGAPLAAGTYGFHVLVSEKEWTLIFSNNYESWGSFQYTKEEDALRVTVPVLKDNFQEWLSYDFIDRQSESAKVQVKWEKTQVLFLVSTDVTANIVADLKKKEEKDAEDFLVLAQQTIKVSPGNIEEAMGYVDASIQIEKMSRNVMFKSELMAMSGQPKRAKSLKLEAKSLAKDFDFYYYGLSEYLLRNDKEKSFKILSENARQHPEDWIAHLSLGEYYLKAGDIKKVVEHFEKAFQYAPDNWRNYARYLYLANKMRLK